MKNTTVMIVGVGLVAGVTGLALYAGRNTEPPAPPPGFKADAAPSPGLAPSGPPSNAPQFPPPNQNPNTPATAGFSNPDGGQPLPMKPPPNQPILMVTAAQPSPVQGGRELPPEGMSSALEAVLKGLGGCFEAARTNVKTVIKAELAFEAWAADGRWTVKKSELKSLEPDVASLKKCLVEQMGTVAGATTHVGAVRFVVPLVYGMPEAIGPMPNSGPPPGAEMQGMPPAGMQGMPPAGMQGMPPAGMQGPPPGMQQGIPGLPPLPGQQAMPPQGTQPQPR